MRNALKPLTFKRNLALALFLILALGCAGGQSLPPGTQTQTDSPKVTAYKALMVNKQIYDATFKSLGLLYSQGKLSEAVKVKAIDLGNKYLAAHNLAVQVLLDNGQPSLGSVKAALEAYLAFVAPYTSGVS